MGTGDWNVQYWDVGDQIMGRPGCPGWGGGVDDRLSGRPSRSSRVLISVVLFWA